MYIWRNIKHHLMLFERQSIYWWNIENGHIFILYVIFSSEVDLHLFLSLLNWWENLLCRMKYSCHKFRQMYKAISIRDWILLGGMKDRGSMCKFHWWAKRFSKFTRGSAVFHNTTRKKKEKFNPYIFILNQNCSVFGYEISVFNTQQGGIQNSRRLIQCTSRERFHRRMNFKLFLMFTVAENTGV